MLRRFYQIILPFSITFTQGSITTVPVNYFIVMFLHVRVARLREKFILIKLARFARNRYVLKLANC